jgi:hypothetical protein
MRIFLILQLLTFIFLFNNSLAQNTELQAKFLDWSVFKSKMKEQTSCYLISLPIKRSGNYEQKEESYFIVTNINNDIDEISVHSGTNYQEDSQVKLYFDSKLFYLNIYLNKAWANNKDEDNKIIKQLQKNAEMTIVSNLTPNITIKDTYSLIGFLQAYKKMKELCNSND